MRPFPESADGARLFIGIGPDEHTRLALTHTARQLRPFVQGRYVQERNYHMTVVFLGRHTAKTASLIRQSMLAAAEGGFRTEALLGEIGVFGSVLWRGIQPCASLTHMACRVRDELTARCVAFDEKPFRPHWTLVRNAAPIAYGQERAPDVSSATPLASFLRQPPVAALPLRKAICPIHSLILYESVSEADGIRYVPRFEVRL